MKKYRVMFETFIHPAFFFHPCYIVEANTVKEAKEKGEDLAEDVKDKVDNQGRTIDVKEVKHSFYDNY